MTGLEWMLHPGVQFGVLGLGLGFCLYLFLVMKAEIGVLQQRGQVREAVLTAEVAAVRAALEALRAELRDVHELTGMLVPPVPAKSGLNLSKRGQVLQLHRRGQTREQIAASLGLPLTEIDLLIKVHQIVLEQVS
jgi:hypothetical protein